MTLAELYQQPGHLIRRAQQLHSALFAEELSALDLTSVQYALLVAIETHPESDATRLASLIYFDRATTGDVLQRLVDKGLVARHPHATDRRVKVIALTPSGTALLQRAKPLVARVQQRLLCKMTGVEGARLTKLLLKLLD